MLCDCCRGLDLEGLLCAPDKNGRLLLHQADAFSLWVSGVNGCKLCKKIDESATFAKHVDLEDNNGRTVKEYDGISDPNLGEEWKQLRIMIKIFTWQHCSNIVFTIKCGEINDGKSQPRYSFGEFRIYTRRNENELVHGLRDPEQFFGKELSGREIAPRADSETIFRIANAWLDQCTGTNDPSLRHGSCHAIQASDCSAFYRTSNGDRRYQGHLQMPSRTINVGPSDGSQQPFLSINSSGVASSESMPWAALSHRWGSSHPLITTSLNIEEFKSGIAMDTLPHTFRDAVHVTRRLGIRHLWIDSLCIMQDSRDDWARESQKMGEVYRCALINICPNSALNCEHGFLNAQRITLNGQMNAADEDTEITLESSKYGSGSLFLGGTVDIWSSSITGDPRGAEPGARLHDRAWVLQEVMLSPRTLHFTSGQLLWECCQNVYMESCIEPIVNMSEERSSFYSNSWTDTSLKRTLVDPPLTLLRTEEDRQWHREMVYQRWYTTVTEYTRRQLTFESDVFPALSGLARSVQSKLGDRYIAGIFDGDMIRGLLWTRFVLRGSKERTFAQNHEYKAPSWSWAHHPADFIWGYSLQSDWPSPMITNEGPCPVVVEAIVHARYPDAETSEHVFGALSGGHLILRTYFRRTQQQDFLYNPKGGFGDTSAFLDKGSHDDYDSMIDEYGEIYLIYMGVFSKLVHALIVIPQSENKEVYKRIGVFIRDKTWFLETQPSWVWQEIKII